MIHNLMNQFINHPSPMNELEGCFEPLYNTKLGTIYYKMIYTFRTG
jgi:hypothetical protein